MLWLQNATTPKGTLKAVLEYLDSVATGYERQSKNIRTKRNSDLDMARCNAIRNVRITLEDCNVMRTLDPE